MNNSTFKQAHTKIIFMMGEISKCYKTNKKKQFNKHYATFLIEFNLSVI